MAPIRILSIAAITVAVHLLLSSAVFAAFGFGSSSNESGLDFVRGYDVNTVTTVTGTALSAPVTGGGDHLIVAVTSGNETLNLVLGPASYWAGKGVPVRANDSLAAKGALAQGRDGKTYMLVEKLTNRTTGSQVTLRNESGKPVWSGPRGMGGGGMRGGGGMMGR